MIAHHIQGESPKSEEIVKEKILIPSGVGSGEANHKSAPEPAKWGQSQGRVSFVLCAKLTLLM